MTSKRGVFVHLGILGASALFAIGVWTRDQQPKALASLDVTVWPGRAGDVQRIVYEGKGNKKVLTSDGIITDADIKAGGPGVQVWLPAGEAYFVPGASNGKIVDDKFLFEGKLVEGVTVEVKNGKSTAISAKSGWDAVKARYDLAGPGKAELSIVDFGCKQKSLEDVFMQVTRGAVQ